MFIGMDRIFFKHGYYGQVIPIYQAETDIHLMQLHTTNFYNLNTFFHLKANCISWNMIILDTRASNVHILLQ